MEPPPPPPDAMDAAATANGPPLQFGRYAVLRKPDGTPHKLGQGGMGVTYKAFDTELERIVALKIIQGDLLARPQSRTRFKREARLTAQLSHPHIATVYDVGSVDGTDFFVMEFIDGEDIQARLRRDGALPWPWVLRAGTQVAQALEAAWRRGILHRDIKPANLMLVGGETRDPAQPFVKVIDFGLARLWEPDDRPGEAISVYGIPMGTPDYASPEQCEGLELDRRTDIYSLGATLWCLLTGKPPFRGTPQQILVSHISRPLTLGELENQPPALVELLRRMLAKDRDHRPADPVELQQAMEQVRASLETRPGPVVVEVGSPPPVVTAEKMLEAYGRLGAGGTWAERYRLIEEMPVSSGRRRFRAERGAPSAGEPVCLEIIDPRLWSNPSVAQRFRAAAKAIAAARQPGLWPCAAIDGDASSGLHYLVRAPTTGTTLLDSLRQGSGALTREKIRWLLEPLPAALDALTRLKCMPPDLPLGSLLVDDSEGAAACFDVFHPLFESEGGTFVPDGQATVGSAVPSPASLMGNGTAYALARLVYDLCGGSLAMLDASGYRPVAKLDEHGNRVLRRALVEGFADCRSFWHELHGLGAAPEPEPTPELEPTPPPPKPPEPVAPPKAASANDVRPVPKANLPAEPDWTNSLGMRFQRIPGLGVDFCIWPTRVCDYAAFAAKEGAEAGVAWRLLGFTQAADHPVAGVNLTQAQAFCRWLTTTEGRSYRLPTDTEWSIAVGMLDVRGKPVQGWRFPGGDEWPLPPNAGNYGGGRGGHVHTSTVGSFAANAYGLYDLGGNVWEWCTDPVQKVGAAFAVLRGGSWNTTSRALALSSARHVAPRDRANHSFGFRVVAAGCP